MPVRTITNTSNVDLQRNISAYTGKGWQLRGEWAEGSGVVIRNGQEVVVQFSRGKNQDLVGEVLQQGRNVRITYKAELTRETEGPRIAPVLGPPAPTPGLPKVGGVPVRSVYKDQVPPVQQGIPISQQVQGMNINELGAAAVKGGTLGYWARAELQRRMTGTPAPAAKKEAEKQIIYQLTPKVGRQIQQLREGEVIFSAAEQKIAPRYEPIVKVPTKQIEFPEAPGYGTVAGPGPMQIEKTYQLPYTPMEGGKVFVTETKTIGEPSFAPTQPLRFFEELAAPPETPITGPADIPVRFAKGVVSPFAAIPIAGARAAKYVVTAKKAGVAPLQIIGGLGYKAGEEVVSGFVELPGLIVERPAFGAGVVAGMLAPTFKVPKGPKVTVLTKEVGQVVPTKIPGTTGVKTGFVIKAGKKQYVGDTTVAIKAIDKSTYAIGEAIVKERRGPIGRVIRGEFKEPETFAVGARGIDIGKIHGFERTFTYARAATKEGKFSDVGALAISKDVSGIKRTLALTEAKGKVYGTGVSFIKPFKGGEIPKGFKITPSKGPKAALPKIAEARTSPAPVISKAVAKALEKPERIMIKGERPSVAPMLIEEQIYYTTPASMAEVTQITRMPTAISQRSVQQVLQQERQLQAQMQSTRTMSELRTEVIPSFKPAVTTSVVPKVKPAVRQRQRQLLDTITSQRARKAIAPPITAMPRPTRMPSPLFMFPEPRKKPRRRLREFEITGTEFIKPLAPPRSLVFGLDELNLRRK